MSRRKVCVIAICLPMVLSLDTYFLPALNPDSSQSSNLTAVVLASTDPIIQLIFPSPPLETDFHLATFGLHTDSLFQCANNSVAVTARLLVAAGNAVRMEECRVKANFLVKTSVIFEVFGGLTLWNCSVSGSLTKGFFVHGAVSLIDCRFSNNQNSIVSALSFGFNLYVKNCAFEYNSSPIGTVFLLGISSFGVTSSTNVTIDGCTFRGNVGLMGGSVLYISVNRNIAFPEQKLSEVRSFSLRNCRFEANRGYVSLISSKFLNSTFANNQFVSHNYTFVLQLYDSSFSLLNSTVTSVFHVLVVTYLKGFLRVADLKVTRITVCPAILIRNPRFSADSIAVISNVEVTNPSYTNQTVYSAAVSAWNAVVDVRDVTVFNGTGFAGICGVFFFSVANITNFHGELMTYLGSLFIFFGSQGVGSGLSLRNVTLVNGALTSVYYSTISLRDLTFAPGEATFLRVPKPHCNVLAAFDSHISLTNGSFLLPPIANFPAFYLWKSSLTISSVSLPVLFSNFINTFEHSELHVSNVQIGFLNANNFVFMSYFCNGTVENVEIGRLVLAAGLVSALSYSQVSVRNISVEKVEIQSLVIASHSWVAIEDLAIEGFRADTLFWYIFDCEILVVNLTVKNAEFDLLQLSSGKIRFENVSFQRIQTRRRFISLSQADIEFDNFSIIGFEAFTVSPFCTAKKSSKILFSRTHFERFRSREQGLMQFDDSFVTILSSNISDYNVTFISAHRSHMVVSGCVIANGGLKLMDVSSQAKVTAGFLECGDCEVTFSGSKFVELSGTNGGVVTITSKSWKSSLMVDNSEFDLCFAENKGGCIAGVAADVLILSSKFSGNRAQSGGVLFFDCGDEKKCKCELSFSAFRLNEAREGGVVKWTKIRPKFTVCSNENNTATYGPFEASLATHTALLNSNNSIMRGVPGVVVVEPILIGFVDVIGQLVATDNSSSAELISNQIIGTNYLIAVNGVANFSGIIVRTNPGNAVPIEVLSASINRTFPGSNLTSSKFVYETRDCVMGEVTTEEGCYLCPKNTFSVDPTEAECRECPFYATCPGGPALILDSGYWRLSENHSDVYLCFLRDSCLGGQNSTCADGYASRLCSACAEDYYSGGLTYCFQCESVYVRGVRTFIVFSFVMFLWLSIYQKSIGLRHSELRETNLATIKIVITFLQSCLTILLINVDLKPVLMTFLSLNQFIQSFSLSSILFECYSNLPNITTIAPVFLNSIFASAFPFLIGLLSGIVFGFLACMKKRNNCFRNWCSGCLTMLYLIHPYIVKTGITLIGCKSIETSAFWLIADASVKCWESPHSVFVFALFIPICVIYIFGFPLLLVLLAFKFRREPYTPALNFFKAGLRAEFENWEFAVLFRKTFLLVILGIFETTDTVIQILSSLVVLYFFLEWTIRTSPYTRPFHNRLEGISLFLQFLFTAMTFYFLAKLHITDILLKALSLTAAVVLFGFIITSLLLILIQIWCRKGRRKKKIETALNESEVNFAGNVCAPPGSVASESIVGMQQDLKAIA